MGRKISSLFSGRIGRVNFIVCAYLLMPLIYLGTVLSMPWMARIFHNDWISIVLGCAILAATVTFYFSFHVRRLHDLGHSGWFSFILFLPLVNLLAVLYLTFTPGEPGENKFGRPPERFLARTGAGPA